MGLDRSDEASRTSGGKNEGVRRVCGHEVGVEGINTAPSRCVEKKKSVTRLKDAYLSQRTMILRWSRQL